MDLLDSVLQGQLSTLREKGFIPMAGEKELGIACCLIVLVIHFLFLNYDGSLYGPMCYVMQL